MSSANGDISGKQCNEVTGEVEIHGIVTKKQNDHQSNSTRPSSSGEAINVGTVYDIGAYGNS